MESSATSREADRAAQRSRFWSQVTLDKNPARSINWYMVAITFHDRATERKALAFLLGRFSGRILKNGEHLVPKAALEALAEENIAFIVKGKANYEQQLAAIRGAASAPVQRPITIE
jgi:hypothetical protein